MSKYSKKQELLKRAIALYNQDYKLATISRELDIHVSTLRKWLRDEGYKAKKNPHGANPKTQPVEETHTIEDEQPSEILLQESTKEDNSLKKADDLVSSYEDVYDATQAALSQGDAYNSATAQVITQKQYEGLKNLRPPKTWKEADLLDRMIERKLGLDNKTTSNVQIDVSILNKTKTVKDNQNVIDAETIDDKDVG